LKKRLLSLLLIFSILGSHIPAPVLAATMPIEQPAQEQTQNPVPEQDQVQAPWFSDVSDDQWFFDAIQYVFQKGIFSGVSDTEFSPEGSMSRGMFVTVLGRLAKIDVEAYRSDSAFSDVDAATYYAPYVTWAASMGITTGMGDNLFAPDSLITRAQMATFIVRFLDASEIPLPDVVAENVPADLDTIPSYAQEAVLKLWRVGFFKGDQDGNFNPDNQATRAEASVLSMRVDTHLEDSGYHAEEDPNQEEPDEKPDEDEKDPKVEEEIIEPYVILFESNGGSPVQDQYLFEGRSLNQLPIPFRENSIFLGWHYDAALTKPVQEKDYILSNLKLYAKYQATTPLVETETPRFASALDQEADFSIILLAPSEMTAEEVKAGIEAKNLNEQKQTDFITVMGSNGVFVLSGTNGFMAGATYKISLINELLSFQGYEASVRSFNFTTVKEKVLNLTLNADLHYIPIEQLRNITADGLAVTELVVPLVVVSDDVVDPEMMTEGTFEYDTVLPVGSKLVVYEGVSPLERDLTTNNEGSVAYITITAVNGSVYTYEQTDAEEVLFVPDVLPVPIDADLDGDSENLSVTLPKIVLTFEDDIYANLDLDSQTTVDVGDYIAFYRGDFGSDAQDAGYARITTVSESLGHYVLAYVMVSQEELFSIMDVYNNKNISGEQMLEGADVEAIEQSVELQARESGFVDEAAELLTILALETNSFTQLRDDYHLTDLKMRTSDGKPITTEEIKLLGGQKVEVEVNKLQATLSTKLQHFTGLSGLRLTLVVGIEIEITISDKAMIVIEIEGTFEEEVRIALNVSGGAQWKVWAIFPYIAEYNVTANIDLYNFTGVGIHASIVTKEKDDENVWGDNKELKNISEELQKLVDAKDKYIGDGTGTVAQGLNEKYAAMLEQESDWVELFSQEIFKSEGGIDPFHILAYEIAVEFVVSANMNISIGCDFWYENAKRYTYSVGVFANSVTSDTVDLVEEHYEFTFYVMGTMGLRAGIRAGIKVGLFTTALASVGFTAEAGVYARVWGYFYYRLSYTASLGRSSSYAGALLFELGIYLEVKFEAQAFAGTFSYNPTLYENEWPLWSAGMRENIQDFAYAEDDVAELAMKKTIRTLSVPDALFEMAYLDLKTGEDDTKIYDDAEHFTITMTNAAFTYTPSTNILSVNPGNAKVQQGQMVLTWITAPLAFTSAPISRNIDLYWDNYNDGYSISYNTNGGSSLPILIARLNANITPPSAPEKQGYVFAGWFADEKLTTTYTFPASMPDTDIMIYAKWNPATNTKVTVEHYLQELNGTYTLATVEDRTSTTDSIFTPAPKSFIGFTTPQSQGVTVKPDGSAILRYYYVRGIYTATFNPGVTGGEIVVNKLKYGASLNVPAMSASGYTFDKWDQTLPKQMPANNLTFTALWSKNNNTPYRVEHYVKTTDQQRYALAESGLEYLSGITDSVITVSNLRRQVEGLTFIRATVQGTEVTSAAISGDGKLVIKLYYDRNQYQVTYQINQQVYATQPYVFQAVLEEPALPVRTGYQFDGWYTHADYAIEHRFSYGEATMPATSFTLYGRWIAQDQKYTLYHNIMNPAGVYERVQADLNQLAKTDSILTLQALAKESFLVDGGIQYSFGKVNQVVQSAVTVPAVGVLVIDLYYERVQHAALWNTNGGTELAAVAYRYGQNIATPTAPTKVGYLFQGWTWQGQVTPAMSLPSGVSMGPADFLFTANWNPALNTVYKVEHYTENLTGDAYALASTESKTGVTDSLAEAVAQSIIGFTYNPNHSEAKPSGAIEPQGTLILRLYYSRNDYRVLWETSGGQITSLSGDYTHDFTPYDAEVLAPISVKTGYVFQKWDGYSAGMKLPSNDLTLTAVWTPATDTTYKVEHYLQNLQSNDYVLNLTEDKTATTEANVQAIPQSFTGFTHYAASTEAVPSGEVLADGSLILKLYYTRNQYTVTFDGNGENSSAPSGATVAYAGLVPAPQNPTRTGYTFEAWTKEATGVTAWNFATDTVTQNSTLFAKWVANSYEVLYDLNYTGAVAGEILSQTYDDLYQLPTPNPVRTGYVFEGWYDATTNGTEVSANTQVGITADQTLYAHWSEATNTPYTVKHYLQNVTGIEYTEAVTELQTLNGVTNASTQATHLTIPGFSGKAIAQTIIAASGDAVVLVYYDRNIHTLTFKPENGTPDLVTEAVRFGTPIVAPDAISKTGYIFGGWGVGATDAMPNANTVYTAIWTPATDTVYQVEHYLQALNGTGYELQFTDDNVGTTEATVEATPKVLSGFTYKADALGSLLSGPVAADGSLILKLYYTRNSYSVTFMDNGAGSSVTPSAVVAYDGKIAQPQNPTRTGYNFENWTKEATGETVWNFLADVVTGNTTLHAQWTANQYEVSFVLNYEAAPAAEKIMQVYETTYVLPGVIPTRAGYAFAGWFTQASGGALVDENTQVILTASQVLFAHWQEGSNTQYGVKHYLQNVTGSEYTEVIGDRQTLTGVTNGLTQATHKTYFGFTGKPIEQTTISANGDAIVAVYYDRNTYTLTFKPENGTADSVTPSIRYGTLIIAPEAPTKTGYVFDTWGVGVADTMPNADKVYMATWSPASNTAYRVEHYLQNLAGSGFDLNLTENNFGTTEATVLAVVQTFTGFSQDANALNTVSSGLVAADGSLVLKLYYNRNHYSLSFNGNGVGSSSTATVSVVYEGKSTQPQNPTRTGYTFEHWTKESTGETAWNFLTDVVTQNTTLYAKWIANQVEVTFDLNYVGAPVAEKINQTYDTVYTLPNTNPQRTGYVFVGWFNLASGGTQVIASTNVVITENQTLFAQWLEATDTPYTVQHYLQNVSDNNYTEALADRQTLTGVTNGTTQATYKTYLGFTGKSIDQTTITANGEAIVQVFYDRNTYTLTFKPENGTADLVTEAVRFGTPIVAPEAPAKTGYTFAGWGVGAQATMPDQDTVYTASWTAVSYAVTFDFNYVNAPESVTGSQSYDQTYQLPITPSRTGYTFLGWFTATEAGNQVLSTTIVAETSAHALYAHWQANQYTVSFDLNYLGSALPESILQTYAQLYNLPSSQPSRVGYTFTGWFTDKTAGTKVESTTTVMMTAAQILYARWAVNQYDITFVLNNGQANVVQSLDFDTTIANAPLPQRAGYTFSGWSPALSKVQGVATYQAEWTTLTYNISYNLANGSLPSDSVNPATYTVESSSITLVVPERTGYTFSGWTGTSLSQATTSVVIAQGSTGHRSYTATWTANTYAIVLNANGGQVVGGTSLQHTYDSQTLLPDTSTTSKIGSTFEGWYETSNFAGSPVSFIAATTTWSGDLTFYAKWTLINYSLSYTALNSTTHANPTTYTYGQSITLTNPTNRSGYSFTGWYENGTKITTVNTLSAKNLVIEARWSLISNTITYYLNSGTNNIANPATYTVNDSVSLANPTRTGYQFDAWYSDASMSLASKITGTAVPLGSTGAKSFYAKWLANTLTVQFNANLGSGTMTAQFLTYDATQALKSNTFERSGYTFNGWALSSGGAKVYSNGGNILNPITEGSLTLYALWTPINYSIAYDLHGGSGTGGNPTGYNIESSSIVLNSATHSTAGYHFAGWYTDAAYTSSATGIPSGSYGNKVFHAKWWNYGVVTIANNGNNTFTISRSGGFDGNQVVYYRTLNGSAIGGTHFTHTQNSVTIPSGQASVTVTITEQGVTATYGSYVATAYSNTNRVYSLEIYQVTGGATLGTTTRATRTLAMNSSYSIDSAYLNNYRQIASSYKSSGGQSGQLISENAAGYNGTLDIGLNASVLSNGAFPASVQNYIRATASAMKVQLASFKATDDGWPMHRYVLFNNKTGNIYFSSDKNGYIPNVPSGTYSATVFGASVDNTDAYTVRLPGTLNVSGTTRTITRWDSKWAGGQDQGDYVLFGLNELCSITISSYNSAGAISSFWFNSAVLDAKPKDTKEPTYLGLAPMSHTSYTIGSKVTIALVYDEIIGSISSGMSVTTNLSTTPFTYQGGVGTNVLYFEGTVTSTAQSASVVTINGSVYDLVN